MNNDIHVYAVGFCNASVCALATVPLDKILSQLNLEHPTGLDHGWELAKVETFRDGTPMPAPCNTHPETRKHYLFHC